MDASIPVDENSFMVKDEGSIELNGNVDILTKKMNDYLTELSKGNKKKEIYLNIRCFSTY